MVLACVSVCLLDKRLGLVHKRWLSKSGVEFLLESLPLLKNYGKAKAMDRAQVLRQECLVGKLHSIPHDLQFLSQKVMSVSKFVPSCPELTQKTPFCSEKQTKNCVSSVS